MWCAACWNHLFELSPAPSHLTCSLFTFVFTFDAFKLCQKPERASGRGAADSPGRWSGRRGGGGLISACQWLVHVFKKRKRSEFLQFVAFCFSFQTRAVSSSVTRADPTRFCTGNPNLRPAHCGWSINYELCHRFLNKVQQTAASRPPVFISISLSDSQQSGSEPPDPVLQYRGSEPPDEGFCSSSSLWTFKMLVLKFKLTWSNSVCQINVSL